MLKRLDSDLQILNDFLKIKTPESWLDFAVSHTSLLLLDHAHCERKAAATALNFISKYPEKHELVSIMSPLAREELLHFEKVIDIMKDRNIPFGPLTPSNYATNLHTNITKRDGSERLSDQLIIGAIIEARSCERFSEVIRILDDPELIRFYSGLVKSEARHFESYLRLAKQYGGSIEQKLEKFLLIENKFINSIDSVFRFHSGIPHPSIHFDDSTRLDVTCI